MRRTVIFSTLLVLDQLDGLLEMSSRVFDTLIQNLGRLRSGRFELPYEEACHARAFPLPVTA